MNFVGVSHSRLKIGDISSRVSSVGCNAVLLFVGINTENYNTEKCVSVEYGTDIPYPENVFKDICVKVREQWNVQNIAIYHRLGSVPIQEASIVIAVSSPDVSESMQAFQYVIMKVKEMSPVTKRNVVEVDDDVICVMEQSVEDGTVSEPKSNADQQPVTDSVPSHLIQIKAGSKEINRRISSFIQRKREEVNTMNILEFCHRYNSCENGNSCARRDSILVRREDGKSHVKVRRVVNEWGPQTRPVGAFSQECQSSVHESELEQSLANSKETSVKKFIGLAGIEQRLRTAEVHLRMFGPVPKDIYERLQLIENRILYLESLSPEYFQSLLNGSHEPFPSGERTGLAVERKKYSEVNNTSQKPFSSGKRICLSLEKKIYSDIDLTKKVAELELKLMSKGE